MSGSKKEIEKIKKLIAKAESTVSEAEAQSFMAKANELLIKYKLTRHDLGEKAEFTSSKFCIKFTEGWEKLLATCLASANMTHAIFYSDPVGTGGMISIYGEDDACDVTLYMYNAVFSTIERMVDKRFNDHKSNFAFEFGLISSYDAAAREGLVQTKEQYYEGYRTGFVVGLNQKFNEEKEKRREEKREHDEMNNIIGIDGTASNGYDLMVKGHLEKLKDHVKSDLGQDIPSEDYSDVKFAANEGSIKGMNDGYKHKHTKGLGAETKPRKSKMIE